MLINLNQTLIQALIKQSWRMYNLITINLVIGSINGEKMVNQKRCEYMKIISFHPFCFYFFHFTFSFLFFLLFLFACLSFPSSSFSFLSSFLLHVYSLTWPSGQSVTRPCSNNKQFLQSFLLYYPKKCFSFI